MTAPSASSPRRAKRHDAACQRDLAVVGAHTEQMQRENRDNTERLTAWVHGEVQGVGFRWATRARALELGLVGHATNWRDGRVLVVAEGPRPELEQLLVWLQSGGTAGRFTLVVESWDAPRGDLSGFAER
jgi:acylphosphatase